MATSGYVVDTFSSKPDYDVILTVANAGTSGNSTRYSWTLKARRFNSVPSYYLDDVPWSANIEGSAYSGGHGLDFRNTTEILLASGTTGYKAHSADGYLTVNYSFSVGPNGLFGSAAGSGSFAANRIPKAPDAPAAPTFNSATATTLNFTTGMSPDNGGSAITTYNFQLATDTAFTNIVQTRTSPASSQTFSGLDPNTNYYLRNNAVNAIGTSAYGAYRLGKTLADKPSAPRFPVAEDLAPTSVHLDWDAPATNNGSAITGYRVRRATNSAFTAGVVEFATGSTATEYDATGLEPSADYFFQIAATNALGTGPWSTTVSITTPSGAYYSTGSSWLSCGIFVSDAGSWKACEVFISNGTSWIAAI